MSSGHPIMAYPYYGGKTSALKKILPQLDFPHHVYVEPFAGSLAVLLNKRRSKFEVVNDAAGEIANFWMQIRENPDELIRLIRATPIGEATFRELPTLPPTDDVLERARRFYCHISIAFSGKPTATKCTSRMDSAFNSRKRLERVADRMRGVEVMNCDAERVIMRKWRGYQAKDRWTCLFYCDPPYLMSTRASPSGDYIHDPKGDDSTAFHESFLKCIKAVSDEGQGRARFCVSGYPSELYSDMLTGWRVFTWKKPKLANVNSKDMSQTLADEVLWMNYDVCGGQADLL